MGSDLDGAVYGEPLGVGGRVIVATEGDSVYALDPANGRVVWRRHLGTPVPLSSLPCGNIDPLGITSTPVYDRTSGSLFVVAEISGPRHVLFALAASTGVVRWSRSVDLPGDNPLAHQQRAALALGNGYVYVGFGGLAGDCGAYRGKVVGVPVTGHGATIAYRVPVAREGAVWATGGPVLDAHGNLYVSVGNGSSTTTYDGSDSVLELSATLQLRSRFAPSRWAQDNATDADLGSLSPVLVPGGWVFIAGKSGIGYVLRQGALGGVGGQVSSRAVCAAFGGAAQTGSTIYVPCTDGLRMIQIGSGGSIQLGWQTRSGATRAARHRRGRHLEPRPRERGAAGAVSLDRRRAGAHRRRPGAPLRLADALGRPRARRHHAGRHRDPGEQLSDRPSPQVASTADGGQRAHRRLQGTENPGSRQAAAPGLQ